MNLLRRLFTTKRSAAEQAWHAAFTAGEAAIAQQSYPQAATHLKAALKAAEAWPDDARTRVTLEAMADVCTALGDFPHSVELLERSSELMLNQTGRESEASATALNNLGCAYRNAGMLDRAEQTLLEALRIREQLLGRDHPDVAGSLNNLAALLDQQNQPQRADEYFRAALAILQRHDRLEEIANVFDNLGAIQMKLGKAEEAEKFMRHGLNAWVVAKGRDSWDYALSANNLARLFFVQQRYAEAEPLIRQTVEIAEATFGPEHAQVADFLSGHAQILEALGRTADSKALATRADRIAGSASA